MKHKNEMPAPPPARKELSDNPVKLCNEIARLFRHRMRESDTHDGVMSQPGAHLVLSTLAVHDGIKQLELVHYTHLRAPTVSVILKKMEAEGLVERKSDPDDLRAVKVHLTEAGRRLDAENISTIKKLDASALRGISNDERELLMVLLPKIRDNLLFEDIGEERE